METYQRNAALVYDATNRSRGKDYAAESQHIHSLIEQHKRVAGNTLLDVACGTGEHLVHLQALYTVEGLDLSTDMLAVARQRLPTVPFHHGDMLVFDLDRRFDVIVCLFSAIGYVKTVENLRRAVHNLARHLQTGGVLIIEPWLTPENYQPGTLHALYVNEPELKLARMSLSQLQGTLSIMEYHFLVATPGGVDHFTEVHEMGLFTTTEYLDAFRAAGLAPTHESEGLIGRGLLIGVKES